MEKKFSEKIKKDINYTKGVLIKFPEEVLEEFKEYAKESAGDCYWLAIKNLLNDTKSNTRLDNIESRIDIIESMLSNEQPKKEINIPHFGRK